MSPAAKTSHRAVVIGPVNVDLFIRGHAPLDPEVLNSWVGPSEVDFLVAGSIGYTIQALQRLGVKVDVCTTFGEDAFGVHLKGAVEQAGIGTSLSRSAPGETAIGIYMLLFGGSKRPMTYRLPSFEPWPDPIPLDGFDGMSLLHCGGLLHFPNMWHRDLAPLFRAGEAHHLSWYSTAHGAHVSGLEAAHKAARFLGHAVPAADSLWLPAALTVPRPAAM